MTLVRQLTSSQAATASSQAAFPVRGARRTKSLAPSEVQKQLHLVRTHNATHNKSLLTSLYGKYFSKFEERQYSSTHNLSRKCSDSLGEGSLNCLNLCMWRLSLGWSSTKRSTPRHANPWKPNQESRVQHLSGSCKIMFMFWSTGFMHSN